MSVHELQQERASLPEVEGTEGLPVFRVLRSPGGGEVKLEEDLVFGARVKVVVTPPGGARLETVVEVYEERTRIYSREGEPSYAKRIFFAKPVGR